MIPGGGSKNAGSAPDSAANGVVKFYHVDVQQLEVQSRLLMMLLARWNTIKETLLTDTRQNLAANNQLSDALDAPQRPNIDQFKDLEAAIRDFQSQLASNKLYNCASS